MSGAGIHDTSGPALLERPVGALDGGRVRPAQLVEHGAQVGDQRLHLDSGGLRLIPGSHRQGSWSMCFRKPYFVSHGEYPAKVCIETEPGDLSVHHGRLWHRVARSQHTGRASLRRSMYLPYLTGPYEPKSDDSPTPAYHRLGEWLRGRNG